MPGQVFTTLLGTNGVCSAPPCADGYFADENGVCTACHPSCAKCSYSGASACTSCASGSYLQGAVCLVNCPAGTFGNAATGLCQSCAGSCLTCSGPSANNCLTCVNGTFLSPVTLSCGATCPSGFYANSNNNSCTSCIQNCQTCNTNSSKCDTCYPSFFVQLDGTCAGSCPQSYFASTTDFKCYACHSCKMRSAEVGKSL